MSNVRNTPNNEPKRYGWTHEKMMMRHTLKRMGYSSKTAARMALRGWGLAK